MPAVNLTDPHGKTLNLAALQGQPVLLNLWATWCAPCVLEMPMLDDLADGMKGRVRVVTVSQDLRGADTVEPFLANRSEEHTSELQSLMRSSYADFCLKKKSTQI